MKRNIRIPVIITALITTGLVSGTALARHHGGHGHGHGHMFERLDQNNDGKITRAEARAAAKKHFNEVDANNDKVLTKAEMKKHRDAKRAEMKDPEKFAAAKIRKHDTNKNGKIEQSESRLPEGKFKKIDTNNDGALSKKEIIAAHEQRMEKHKNRKRGDNKRGDKHEKRAAKRFAKMDASGDGKITMEEAKAAMDEKFSRIDKNNDNVLTRAEAKQMKRRGEKGKDKRQSRHNDKHK